MVDYRAVGSLSAYLTEAYNSRPFDIILDTIGTQALYEGCPGYLKATGVYINVGSFEGAFWTLWCWKKNTLWPTLLGGVPRKYIMFSTFPNGKQAEKLAEMVRQGKLKVAIDSVVEMEDLLKGGTRHLLTRV